MMNTNTARTRFWTVFHDEDNSDSVRPSDLIRVQRSEEPGWTVFHDEETVIHERRRRRRDTLASTASSSWTTVKEFDEHDKENIGYVVRRPKRAREEPTVSSNTTETEPDTTPVSKTNSKRKQQSPSTTPKKQKTSTTTATKKKKDPAVQVRREQRAPVVRDEIVDSERDQRQRRPLEDITHLFVDPHAHYFQPWRRASRVAPRASTVRMM